MSASQNTSQQSTRATIQARQDAANQAANRSFLEASARGGDTKSIQALASQGVPVVTIQEGPYSRTYVGEQQVQQGLQRAESSKYTDSSGNVLSHYSVNETKSPYLQRRDDGYYVRDQYIQQQRQQAQQLQNLQTMALSERHGASAGISIDKTGRVTRQYSERITPEGILGEERITTRQPVNDIFLAPDDATFDIEIGGVKKTGVSKKDALEAMFLSQEQQRQETQKIRSSLLEAKQQGVRLVDVREGSKTRKLTINEAIVADFDLSQGVTITPRISPYQGYQMQQQKKEQAKQKEDVLSFIGTAESQGASFIQMTDKEGRTRSVPVKSAAEKIFAEQGEFSLSYKPKGSQEYSQWVDESLGPQPKSLEQNITYYAQRAASPVSDFIYPAASFITKKEIPYTPSTGGLAIDAFITSSKYSLGFGDKDQSGKPIDQSFGTTFKPIGEGIAKDPLGFAVQLPAEAAITIVGGRATTAGSALIKRGIIEPVVKSAARRELTTQLTKTFTGQAPRKTVTTTFGEPVVQKSAVRSAGALDDTSYALKVAERENLSKSLGKFESEVQPKIQRLEREADYLEKNFGKPVAESTRAELAGLKKLYSETMAREKPRLSRLESELATRRATQEIATEVIIPIKRTVNRPDVIVQPVPGRTDLFKVEGGRVAEIFGGSSKAATKDLYAQKVGKETFLIVVEQPVTGAPKKVLVRGQIGFDTAEQVARQQQFGLTQVGPDLFTTLGKPTPTFLKLLGTQALSPQATVSRYAFSEVQKNPRQFARYFFGPESREQMQTALRSMEKPRSGKPLDDFTIADTKSFGTVGSRVGPAKGKVRATGEIAMVKGVETTTKVRNPLKMNVGILNRRIGDELKNLATLGRKDVREREISERALRGLERSRERIAQQPAEIEFKTRTPAPKEVLAGQAEKGVFRIPLGRFAFGARRPELYKAFGKRKRPTDSFTADILGIGGSFEERTKIASKTGRPFTLGGAAKTTGAAGGSARARGISLTSQETTKIVSQATPKPRVRGDALGDYSAPVYLKAYPAMEIQGASALEPQSISSRRPVSAFGDMWRYTGARQSPADLSLFAVRPSASMRFTEQARSLTPQVQKTTPLSGLLQSDKLLSGEFFKTTPTSRTSLKTGLDNILITRDLTGQRTTPIQIQSRGFGQNVPLQRQQGLWNVPPINTKFGGLWGPPFPGGGGGGLGGFGGGGGKRGFTGLFKMSVYNPLAPSLSLGVTKKGERKRKQQDFIF